MVWNWGCNAAVCRGNAHIHPVAEDGGRRAAEGIPDESKMPLDAQAFIGV